MRDLILLFIQPKAKDRTSLFGKLRVGQVLPNGFRVLFICLLNNFLFNDDKCWLSLAIGNRTKKSLPWWFKYTIWSPVTPNQASVDVDIIMSVSSFFIFSTNWRQRFKPIYPFYTMVNRRSNTISSISTASLHLHNFKANSVNGSLSETNEFKWTFHSV